MQGCVDLVAIVQYQWNLRSADAVHLLLNDGDDLKHYLLDLMIQLARVHLRLGTLHTQQFQQAQLTLAAV